MDVGRYLRGVHRPIHALSLARYIGAHGGSERRSAEHALRKEGGVCLISLSIVQRPTSKQAKTTLLESTTRTPAGWSGYLVSVGIKARPHYEEYDSMCIQLSLSDWDTIRTITQPQMTAQLPTATGDAYHTMTGGRESYGASVRIRS